MAQQERSDGRTSQGEVVGSITYGTNMGGSRNSAGAVSPCGGLGASHFTRGEGVLGSLPAWTPWSATTRMQPSGPREPQDPTSATWDQNGPTKLTSILKPGTPNRGGIQRIRLSAVATYSVPLSCSSCSSRNHNTPIHVNSVS